MSKMECMAIQMQPMSDTKVVMISELKENSGEHWSRCRRLCSHLRHDIFIGILLLLLLLSFVSQCALFMYIRGVQNELETLKNQINNGDLHTAKSTMPLRESAFEKRNLGEELTKHRRRKERSHDWPRIPHFYLKGNGKEDYGDNRVLWGDGNGIDPSHFVVGRSGNSVASITIQTAGVYFIYVQISIHGRIGDSNPLFPTVGFTLKKGNTVLSEALITQDERGVIYGGTHRQRPRDTLALSGLFYLTRADRLTIEPLEHLLNDHRIQYSIDNETSHFGGFLVQRR